MKQLLPDDLKIVIQEACLFQCLTLTKKKYQDNNEE